MPTITEILKQAQSSLKGPESKLESEVLMQSICGFSRSQQFSHPDKQLTELQLKKFIAALQRRQAGEPLAHITGSRGFWDMDLKVSADVLIPRPDTECLVEQALDRVPADAEWQIADLGTGSGAIAIAIARERPCCEITATDISEIALEVAKDNARALTAENIMFRAGSWTQALGEGAFDMIASNPPYICADDPHLQQGDLSAEPVIALISGEDGLDAIRQIITECQKNLKSGGWLLLEHGFDQADDVTSLLQNAAYSEIFTHKDYGGNDRVTGGRKAG
jgi:release factor glutamine methyltransferase